MFEQAAFRRLLDQVVRAFAKQPEPARLHWVDIDKEANDLKRGGTSLEQLMLPLLLVLTFGMTGALFHRSCGSTWRCWQAALLSYS